MKLRIAIWSGLGALVVVFWRVYISLTFSNPLGAGGVGPGSRPSDLPDFDCQPTPPANILLRPLL
jgi:hypothetical protein